MIFQSPLLRTGRLLPIIISYALIAGCTQQSTSTSAGLPTNTVVISATISSITITWTRASGDASADTIFVTTSTGMRAGNSPVIVTPGDTGTVTNLAVDSLYSITIGTSTGHSTPITYTIGAPPSGLTVNSVDANSIGAAWTRGAGDAGYDTIVAMKGNSVISTSATLGVGGAVIGLSEDSVYAISIHMSSGVSDTIIWMTAERFTGLHLYEEDDTNPTDSTALVLAANGTKAISLMGANNADFVLDVDTTASGISLDAGSVHSSGWNATRWNPNPNYIPGGLNNDYRDTDYSKDLLAATANSYQIPDDSIYNMKGSRVLICKTAGGNLALVEIMPVDSTGLLFTYSPNGYKYITVNVSLQTAPSSIAPYAGRGRRHYSGPAERIPSY